MADPKPGDGNAAQLKRYWAYGAGKTKWYASAHPWSTLNALLKKHGVPKHMVDGLTTNIYVMAKGHGPAKD